MKRLQKSKNCCLCSLFAIFEATNQSSGSSSAMMSMMQQMMQEGSSSGGSQPGGNNQGGDAAVPTEVKGSGDGEKLSSTYSHSGHNHGIPVGVRRHVHKFWRRIQQFPALLLRIDPDCRQERPHHTHSS